MNAKGPGPGNANLRIGTKYLWQIPIAVPENHRTLRRFWDIVVPINERGRPGIADFFSDPDEIWDHWTRLHPGSLIHNILLTPFGDPFSMGTDVWAVRGRDNWRFSSVGRSTRARARRRGNAVHIARRLAPVRHGHFRRPREGTVTLRWKQIARCDPMPPKFRYRSTFSKAGRIWPISWPGFWTCLQR